MDFMKAYDRVNRKTMEKVLKKMKLGKKFRKMISILYEETLAKVEVNGKLSESFETTGGVRQGLPSKSILIYNNFGIIDGIDRGSQ